MKVPDVGLGLSLFGLGRVGLDQRRPTVMVVVGLLGIDQVGETELLSRSGQKVEQFGPDGTFAIIRHDHRIGLR